MWFEGTAQAPCVGGLCRLVYYAGELHCFEFLRIQNIHRPQDVDILHRQIAVQEKPESSGGLQFTLTVNHLACLEPRLLPLGPDWQKTCPSLWHHEPNMVASLITFLHSPHSGALWWSVHRNSFGRKHHPTVTHVAILCLARFEHATGYCNAQLIHITCKTGATPTVFRMNIQVWNNP